MFDLLFAAQIAAAEYNLFTVNTLLAFGSATVTAYFWFIKSNRERMGVKVHQASKFKGNQRDREKDDKKISKVWWEGEVFMTNRSTLPCGLYRAQVDLHRDGKWVRGDFGWGEGGELPYNLPPLEVVPKKIAGFFDLEPEFKWDDAQKQYKLRFTFETVDGKRIRFVVDTHYDPYQHPIDD